MKRPLLSALLSIVTVGPLAASVPEALPLERYDGLMKNSPFALATAPVAPVAAAQETPSFAKDFYVVGIAQIGETPFVTISTRDRQRRFSLSLGESSADGITLTNVEWLPGVGKSKVTLRKDEALGVIGFDEAAMQPSAPPVVPQPTQMANHGAGQGGGGDGWEERRRERRERRAESGQHPGQRFQWSQQREERRERWLRRQRQIRGQ